MEILIRSVRNESNPTFVSRALELLNATQHPRLVVIFTDLMSVPREQTCLDVLEYLQMPHLYGDESLYPLDLANKSSYLSVRQAALRGYATLAERRSADSSNTTYQMAFERISHCFMKMAKTTLLPTLFNCCLHNNSHLSPVLKEC